MEERIILSQKKIDIILERMTHELYENRIDLSNTAIIGLLPRGKEFAKSIHKRLCHMSGIDINFGTLDSTFYRDDFRRSDKPILPSAMHLDFQIEGKYIVLVDDVLYTGRSVRSALNALTDFGRPLKTELMVLIDRRYNRELPIQPDYVGEVVDTRAHDKVKVSFENSEKKVWISTIQQ
jgi:pyrimidine operon attenuation protein/uracil phosphoribosyltransferase